MTTYVNVQSRIADDLNRTDLGTQIQREIKSAIRHYRKYPMWWNEAHTSLTASSSAVYVSVPSDFLELQELYINISDYPVRLEQKDLNEIIEYRPTSGSQPTAFAYWGDRFELNFEVNQQYTFECYYIKELTELSSDSDENEWIISGEDLIVYRAEKMLYANVIKDSRMALQCAALERSAMNSLLGFRDLRIGSGQNKAWGY